MQTTNQIRVPLNGPQDSRTKDSPQSKSPLAFPYTQSVSAPSTEAPLSMRFMHKPSRATTELEKARDPTRQNSIANSQLHPCDPHSSMEVSSDECSSPTPRVRSHPHSSSYLSDTVEDGPHSHELVRKKSGEIVKSLLKESSSSDKLRARSLPSTPTYKQVHFGGDTDVKYFKAKDRPAAISASNSPTQIYDDDDDDDIARLAINKGEIASLARTTPRSYFDYYDDELNSHVETRQKTQVSQTPASHSDWTLEFKNFSFRSYHERITLQHRPLFLENMFVSVDGKYLLGQIAVLNLAYEKSVTIRYSLDDWSTIVEIQAFYVPDSPSVLKSHNYDRFMFKIALDSFVNCFPQRFKSQTNQPITSQMCIRFVCPGQDIWDNNDQQNYQFILKQDAKPSTDKIPSAAKTKQDTHIKKPKYSSSYLKKRHSAPHTSTSSFDKASSSPRFFDRRSWPSPDFDDFQSNSYYLSSPLLNYTTKNNFKDLLDDQLNNNHDSHANGRTFGADFSTDLRLSNSPSTESSPSPEQSSSPPDAEKKPHESMSYKELLDSYCFFNSNSNDGGSKTTLVLSEEPGTQMDPNKVVNNDAGNSDPVFTVSSFLK